MMIDGWMPARAWNVGRIANLRNGYDAFISHVVCLTEPSIVDALFERAGALLIPMLLRARRSAGISWGLTPFAILDAGAMAELRDGEHIGIEPGLTRIVRQ